MMSTRRLQVAAVALILCAALCCVADFAEAQRPRERTGAAGEGGSGGSESTLRATPGGGRLDVRVTGAGVSVFAVNADAHDVFSRIASATGMPLIVDDAA